MAISKSQPMRSAEIEIIDEIDSFSEGLANEISDREQADTVLGQRITAETNARIQETNARIQADTALGQRINGEIANRQNADTDIQNQIGTGFSSSHTIAQSLNATNNTVSDIETEIGDGFDSQNTITAYKTALDAFLGDRTQLDDTVVDAILDLVNATELLGAFRNRFKIGLIENVTIPANDSVSTSHVFATPFESTDSCILLAQVVTSDLYSLFTYTLISCTYSGFSYSIANSDAEAHTVSLGYVAIKTSA